MLSKKLCVLALSAASLFGQEAGSKWVPLDGSKEGTPAEIRLDVRTSSSTQTSLEVVIHGFYLEPKKGPDGEYQKVTVPGLGQGSATGAPDLPVARFNIAIATTAKEGRLAEVKETIPAKTFTGINVWPKTIGELDDEKGTPEQFRKDEKIYLSKDTYPAKDAGLGSLSAILANVPGLAGESYPVKWNPSTRTLSVRPSTRFVFSHSGTATRTPVTRDRARLASQIFVNWEVVQGGILVNTLFYEGDFLFIYPTGYKDELQPLINQKKVRGFVTSERTTIQTGNTCASIRAAIQAWYNSRPVWTDKYALLVGDVNEIPLCTAPTGVPTDDLYASTNGDDLDEEIYLGRLSVDSQADAANQVSKILSYEDSPSLFCCYDKALLVAHKEGAPGKYVGAHESVRLAAYSTPPSFSTLYGNSAAVDDGDVSLKINQGQGLVAYRGHGSDSAWTGWNTFNQYYDLADVTGLSNLTPQVPVLWSFACNNNELGVADSIGETWMEDFNNRAVSHYGSTVPSYTSQNHDLDRKMFKAVYDSGLTIQSHAIKLAEAEMGAISGTDNAWMYLLLGDPEMKIRRRNPLNFVIEIPSIYKVCYGPACYLSVSVYDRVGNPAPFVKVAAYKGLGARDEVFNNRFTDKNGKAQIPVSGITAGKLIVTFEDDAGNSVVKTVAVQ